MASQVNVTAVIAKGRETCTLPSILHEALPIVDTWTFHNIITVVAGISTIFTLLFSLGLVGRHLANYTVPHEQRQIVRVVLTPFIFAIFNFFSIWFYPAAAYLQPVADLYEVFGIVAIFLLFVAYVCPDPRNYDTYFANIERRNGFRPKKKVHDMGSLRWFYWSWIEVFQILFVRLAVTVALWSLHATVCPLDPALSRDTIVVEVIESFFTTVCVLAVVRFYRRLAGSLKSHHAASKLIWFKVIVGIQILQGPVFAGLLEGGLLKPTAHVSYEDYSIGVPALCTCGEMFIFSFAFLWPFGPKEYIAAARGDAERAGLRPLGVARALLDVLNISDVVRGAFTFRKMGQVFFHKGATRKVHHPAPEWMVREQECHNGVPAVADDDENAARLAQKQAALNEMSASSREPSHTPTGERF